MRKIGVTKDQILENIKSNKKKAEAAKKAEAEKSKK
jgi:hypothetical protein